MVDEMLEDNTGEFCSRKPETPVSPATEVFIVHAAICCGFKILLSNIYTRKKKKRKSASS